MQKDIYIEVTNRIIKDLESGTPIWRKSWISTGSPLRYNGVPYRGVNVVMLWVQSAAMGYDSPYWLSFKQALELGGAVKKGETGTRIVFTSTFEKEEKTIPFLKSYSVFNACQCERLPDRFYAKPVVTEEQRIEHAEAFFKATGSEIRHGGDRACYIPSRDYIQMPPFEAFNSSVAYYSVLAHEHIHWTGAKPRLDRTFGKRFGDEAYAFEELVAELGAAFLCAELRLEPEVRKDHSAYISSWLRVLKQDKKAIFTAASAAQKAADFLVNLDHEAFLQVAA